MEDKPTTQTETAPSAGHVITPYNEASNSADGVVASTGQVNSVLSAPIWFDYPQSKAAAMSRRLHAGTISIDSGGRLNIASSQAGEVADYQLTSIKQIKRSKPSMTFTFDDGNKFEISFFDKTKSGIGSVPILGILINMTKSDYKQGVANMTQFERYFKNAGLV